MLANSTFKKEDIDRERGVIVEEINMYEDNPQSQMMDLLDEMTFGPTHPLGWNIAGTREIIRTVPRDTLLDYRSRFYNPEHMCVAIAGHVPKGAWALLESTFGSWKTVKKSEAPKQTEAFSPTTVKGVRLSFQQKKIEQVQLGMSFLTHPILDPRHDAARVLAVILGGTMSSRLFTEVREKRGLCYHISASRSSFEDIGTFRIVAGLEKTRLQEAVEVIWKELDSVAKKGVSAQELTRAKDFHRGKFYLEFEDPFVQADWYGDQLRYREDWVSPEERMKRIQAVTPKQIQAVAKEIFDRKNYAVSVVGPFASAKDIEKWF
jgi:predicted Zn-dependent peptidase